uniref:NADH-ubiquinone oxidoreductase chain 1 n=5 Tax=Ixodidae TaxID=6939 RepID=V9MMD0_RHIMP|nr:NADH dehydrogenase subunit 1 [Rhipicephalus microplus]AGH19726.1 NADH dehydrogenase subunit 1 [Rhipicephalus microplus]AGH19739.1 NADH dehydrogenase subunit 1 [Rhipicephalus microplus]AKC05535.1 NADH dehydrogenase subunit 1 [Rhipicephalus microplus]QGG43653.1 NADH dehydrogenase subunit 1 [Rhipicephalus microplus]QLD97317.1 NADH dehydrogenase subunit 1 [Rhipicephalus microplus]
MLNLIYFMMLILMVLLSIAFFTLMERKFLGYCHFRKGPNKTGILGLFQPFSDAIKLFSKEMNKMFYMNKNLQIIAPIFMIIMMIMMWMIFQFSNTALNLSMSIIFFLCISSLSSYSILFSGWASNSKYSLIGSYRGFAQVISYEVSMALILITMSIMPQSFNLFYFFKLQTYYPLIFSMFPVFIIWFISILAELNRVPFDLAEGESELVSGFNIEYGSWLFAIIFMSEYGNIMIISYLTNYLFLGFKNLSQFSILMIMFIIIMMRGTYVRMRYDQLMMMAWKIILPQSIILLFLIYFIFLNMFYFICINFCN